MPSAYRQSLDYLYGLEKFGMIFGLTQVEKILEAIGNPHEEIQSIHIGGTERERIDRGDDGFDPS